MKTRAKMMIGGAVTGLTLLALTVAPISAQQTPPQTPGGAPTHEQMDQMMDAAHGPGTADRMHEAMGQGDAQRGEQLMQQCVSMMGMMQNMQGIMGGNGMSGMMGGQGGQSMQDMMNGTLGR